MSDSRRQILEALRAAPRPFPDLEDAEEYRPVVPRTAENADALADQFALQAEQQAAEVHRVPDNEQALAMLLTLLEEQQTIASWDPGEIAVPGLQEALRNAGIVIAAPDDATPEVGLTGALAGLAATGSLVLSSGPGVFRNTSLLPATHIAILRQEQLLPDLESWFAAQRRQNFHHMRRASSIVVITGPSRTADIAMELVMGMHGPRALHIILVGSAQTNNATQVGN